MNAMQDSVNIPRKLEYWVFRRRRKWKCCHVCKWN